MYDYCPCRQKRRGGLIACDGAGCGTWHHLVCAGLSDAPEGNWFCADCVVATAGLQGPAADAALAVSIRERAGFATGEDGYGARDPPEGLLSTFSAAAVERLAHE